MFHQPHNSQGNFNFNAFIYSGTGYQDHFHRNFEVIYILKGSAPVRVGHEQYTLHAREMVLIPPWHVHSFSVTEENLVWVGVFSKDFISKFAHREEGQRFSPFQCDPSADQFLREQLFTADAPPRYLLMASLYLICDQCMKFAKVSQSEEQSALRDKILRYIEEHYTQQISMQETAEALGYEYHYFSQLFHDCFEMNFRAFINIYRFDLACELLTETEKEIIDIAMESGFQSLRNFNRIFKTLSGSTPQEYRNHVRRSPPLPHRKT